MESHRAIHQEQGLMRGRPGQVLEACRALTRREELRCLAGKPFCLPLHRLAPVGMALAA